MITNILAMIRHLKFSVTRAPGTEDSSTDANIGVIVGSVVGGLALIVLVVVVVCWYKSTHASVGAMSVSIW